MDYMAQERERGITINAAAITFPWKKHQVGTGAVVIPSTGGTEVLGLNPPRVKVFM
jgi:translation elongation factor EF-4